MSVQAGSLGRQATGAEAQDLRPQFRLRPGQDDELIEWLASLAPRRRSAAIRAALYQHLAVREEAGGSGDWTEDPDLAAALDALF
jgi:hypothetical protein